jgi:EmrB/QacA subfamily drug resistance transporter
MARDGRGIVADTTSKTRGKRYGNKWYVLVAASVGLFLVVVDSTIVNISVPAMIRGLNADLSSVEWVLNAYTLIFASLLIPMGRTGDMFGRKRVFLIGLALFGTASAACGLAPTIGALVASRVFQAVGAAAMMPATLSFVQVSFEPRERGLAFGVWAAISGFGIGIGPTLGGFLTQYDWRYIFFVNVPIVAVAFFYTVLVVPESKDAECHSIDWTGGVLWVTAFTAFNYGVIEGPAVNWGGAVPWLLVGSVALMAAFLWWESRASEPMLNLGLFRTSAFSAGNAATTALLFGMVGGFFLIPLFLQDGLGFTALRTGLTLAPIALVLMVIGPFVGSLSDRHPPRWFMVPGMLIVSGALLWISTITTADTPMTLLPRFLLLGMGAGLAISPVTNAVMGTVPVEFAGSASGTVATAQRVGAVLGVAVLGAVLQVTLATSLSADLANVPGLDPIAVQRIVAADKATATGLVGGVTSLEESLASAGLTPAQAAALKPRVAAVAGGALVAAMAVALRVGAAVEFFGALIAAFVVRRRDLGGGTAQRVEV